VQQCLGVCEKTGPIVIAKIRLLTNYIHATEKSWPNKLNYAEQKSWPNKSNYMERSNHGLTYSNIYMERSSWGLIMGTIQAPAWSKWGKPQMILVLDWRACRKSEKIHHGNLSPGWGLKSGPTKNEAGLLPTMWRYAPDKYQTINRSKTVSHSRKPHQCYVLASTYHALPFHGPCDSLWMILAPNGHLYPNQHNVGA